MNHPNEEELIAYHGGEPAKRETIASHVADCPECRAELARIDAVLTALSSLPVPDPGADYGARVWQKIAPRLPERPPQRWWQFDSSSLAAGWRAWLEPRRLAALGAVAALAIVAFVAGRVTKPPVPVAVIADASKIRERVLVMAVGEHLGRSEMMLIELGNAEPENAKQKEVNISTERRRAEDLVEENRMYRQTALEQGDTALAGVLDELERVLLDVAHGPGEVTPAQLDEMQQRIAARGILFKVRVVGKELQQRERSAASATVQSGSGTGERNKI
ncbi:MAG TPA: hypothetical protein VH022_06470 [Candidatus Acidoferrum sp.]|jgi:hypothetical protein|nr:hypothetical protein [Candidatus Acidoferrum sp.]